MTKADLAWLRDYIEELEASVELEWGLPPEDEAKQKRAEKILAELERQLPA